MIVLRIRSRAIGSFVHGPRFVSVPPLGGKMTKKNQVEGAEMISQAVGRNRSNHDESKRDIFRGGRETTN